MSSDIRLAFNNLEARAEASAGDNPPDRISLRDYLVDVEIGAFQAERGTTQRVCFNIVVEVQLPQKPLRDDVDRILSYDTITEAIGAELAFERLNLLETLAERIAARILEEPAAARVFIRIEKLDRGPGALGVEIVRCRAPGDPADIQPQADAENRPRVVFLSNRAILSSHLAGWIDQLEAAGEPVIFCVGMPDGPAPVAKVAAAQRRIDLLAAEQNAWVLAGRDRRCIVMRSRTELDWAVQNDQISVWAPSKFVLDSTDIVAPEDESGLALVVWFCGQMDATELLVIGGQAPATATGGMPVREMNFDQVSVPGILPAPSDQR